jgi:four helix bundle protein
VAECQHLESEKGDWLSVELTSQSLKDCVAEDLRTLEYVAADGSVVLEARQTYHSASIRVFEDLICWQKARTLCASVYRVTRTPAAAVERDLCRQLQRATVSVMSNIAEGHERRSLADYCHFLYTAKASCAECRSLLYVFLDTGLIDEEVFCELYAAANEIGMIVGGLRAAIERKKTTT